MSYIEFINDYINDEEMVHKTFEKFQDIFLPGHYDINKKRAAVFGLLTNGNRYIDFSKTTLKELKEYRTKFYNIYYNLIFEGE